MSNPEVEGINNAYIYIRKIMWKRKQKARDNGPKKMPRDKDKRRYKACAAPELRD